MTTGRGGESDTIQTGEKRQELTQMYGPAAFRK